MHVELIIYVCTKKLHSVTGIFNTCITLSGRIKADRTCVFSPTLLNYYDKFVKKPDYSAFFYTGTVVPVLFGSSSYKLQL